MKLIKGGQCLLLSTNAPAGKTDNECHRVVSFVNRSLGKHGGINLFTNTVIITSSKGQKINEYTSFALCLERLLLVLR